MKHLWLITVHDEDGNTIASSEAPNANGALQKVVELEKYLNNLAKEVAEMPVITEAELGA